MVRQMQSNKSEFQSAYRPTRNPPKAEFKDQMIAYLQSSLTQRTKTPVASDWVPSRIMLPKDVRGDGPWFNRVAVAGEYECKCNVWGAMSVVADDGEMLGIKPSECEILEFCWNEKKQIMAKEKEREH